MDSRAKALIAARAALDKHAEAICVIDVHAISTITDFFVILSAGSTRQLDAIRRHIEDELAVRSLKVWHTEGISQERASVGHPDEVPQWILMDCGDFVVHLLDSRSREFYQLEHLWADAPRVVLSASAERS